MAFRIQQLPRASLMPIGLFAVGVLAVVGYVRVTRDGAPPTATTAVATRQVAIPSPPPQSDKVAANAVPASATVEAPADAEETDATSAAPESVSTLIAQATGTDAAKRAAAITALGTAPKEEALPVLSQLLDTADDSEVGLALSSLSTLARKQGDDDDRVRSVIRRVVSHSSDDLAVQAAQQTLDEIDRDLSKVASAGKNTRG